MEKENSLNEMCNTFIDNVKKYVEDATNTPKIYTLKELPYDDRKVIYNNEFDLGNLSDKIETKLILISLICSFVLSARVKSPSISTLECVKRLTDYDKLAPNEKILGSDHFYENLAIICDSFLYGVKEGNTFGLKTAVEIKAKIKEILSMHFPF